ncbi:MAG: GAF domain-containing protein [Solirubrobacteraceae bacterium]
MEELGSSLEAAGARAGELALVLADAVDELDELGRLLTGARDAHRAAAETAVRVNVLETELDQRGAELEAMRQTHERDSAALAAEAQARTEWEARADEANRHSDHLDVLLAQERARSAELEESHGRQRARAEELDASLAAEQARAAELEAALADAQVSTATAAQDSKAARLRAEAARLDADAARLEAEASQEDVAIAQRAAMRSQRVAESAIEQMRALQAQWDAEHNIAQADVEAAEAMPPADGDAVGSGDAESRTGMDGAPAPDDGATDDADASLPDRAPGYAAGVGADQHAVDGPVQPPGIKVRTGPSWTHSAQLALASALVDCRSSRTVLSEGERVIGSRGGWDAVITWSRTSRSKRYVCSAIWSSEPHAMAQFEASTLQVRLDAYTSAIGRAAADGALTWYGDLGNEGDGHLAALASHGMASVVILPVRRDSETIAVLELCSRAAGELDEDLRKALETTADELAYVHTRLCATETTRWSWWWRR